jgi:PqqD family protein of HPr-rel-A system
MTPLDTSRLRDLALSDQGFVFDPLSGYTFTVNPTGLLVLRLLKEGRGTAAIVHELQETFELDGGEDVGRDVDEMILRLREQGLVK